MDLISTSAFAKVHIPDGELNHILLHLFLFLFIHFKNGKSADELGQGHESVVKVFISVEIDFFFHFIIVVTKQR